MPISCKVRRIFKEEESGGVLGMLLVFRYHGTKTLPPKIAVKSGMKENSFFSEMTSSALHAQTIEGKNKSSCMFFHPLYAICSFDTWLCWYSIVFIPLFFAALLMAMIASP